MKPVFFTVVVMLFAIFQAPILMANEAQELRTKSDQYYEKSDFKKAYKGYYKLA